MLPIGQDISDHKRYLLHIDLLMKTPNDIVKAQQEEQTEAPCPALPNSQPDTLRVGPRAAAQAMLLTVASLRNSLLLTSFLCRVTRRSLSSCCLSQQSGSNLRDATSDS